jgi:hypothetical protein
MAVAKTAGIKSVILNSMRGGALGSMGAVSPLRTSLESSFARVMVGARQVLVCKIYQCLFYGTMGGGASAPSAQKSQLSALLIVVMHKQDCFMGTAHPNKNSKPKLGFAKLEYIWGNCWSSEYHYPLKLTNMTSQKKL